MNETMYWADYNMTMGISIWIGVVIALLMIVFLWAKGKPFQGFYGGLIILFLSPLWSFWVLPLAIMYVYKTLKEVK